MNEITLPDLPDPNVLEGIVTGWGHAYTAEQMRDYARTALSTRASAGEGGVPEAVRYALRSYRLQFTKHDEDGPLSLFDVLTPPGDVDIGRGQQELELLADHINSELAYKCCIKADELGVRICSDCAEASAAYSAAMGIPDWERIENVRSALLFAASNPHLYDKDCLREEIFRLAAMLEAEKITAAPQPAQTQGEG